MRSFILATEKDTEKIATELAAVFRAGDCVGLSGELGAGKTTFVRYVVEAMGGDARIVSSPSYTLEHDYGLLLGVRMEHWDLYRVRELPDELREPPGPHVIRLLEWPERCPELENLITISCSFTVETDGSRRLKVSSHDDPSRLSRLHDGGVV